MKNMMLFFSLILVFCLVGCNFNQNEVDNNLSGDKENQQQDEIDVNEDDLISKNLMDVLSELAESGDEKQQGFCSFFVADSVHEDTPGGYGGGMPETYYFLSNNTYFWDAGDYYNPMERVRAKAGTWKIEMLDNSSDSLQKGRLVLDEKYALYLEGNEIGEVDLPGGETANGLVNYDFALRKINSVITEDIEFVRVSEYSLGMGNVESPAYEYKLGNRVMFSNVAKINKNISDFVKEDFHVSSENWVNSLIELMIRKKDDKEVELILDLS